MLKYIAVTFVHTWSLTIYVEVYRRNICAYLSLTIYVEVLARSKALLDATF